jgi:hypothetical protein
MTATKTILRAVQLAGAMLPGGLTIACGGDGESGSAGTTPVIPLAPSVAVSTTTVSIVVVRGAATPTQVVRVSNAGGGSLGQLSATVTYPRDGAAGWLSALLGSTTAPADLTLMPSVGSLADGTYTATVKVTGSEVAGTSSTVNVRFVVASPPTLAANYYALLFTLVKPDSIPPALPDVALYNSASGVVTGLGASVAYAAGETTGWLNPTITVPSTPSVLKVLPVASTLPAGTYHAIITVTSANSASGPISVAVTLVVLAPPTLQLNAAALTFTDGGISAIGINNAGGGVLPAVTAAVRYTAGQPQNWLSISVSPVKGGWQIFVATTSTGLPPGTYSAFIDVAAPGAINSPQTVPVTLVITGNP